MNFCSTTAPAAPLAALAPAAGGAGRASHRTSYAFRDAANWPAAARRNYFAAMKARLNMTLGAGTRNATGPDGDGNGQ